MITKNYNLLNEQLAESGLEMTAAWVAPAISVVQSIAGGIVGSSAQASANKAQRAAEKQARKAGKQAVRDQNRANLQAWREEKENYEIQRQYEYESAIKNWERQNEIQDFQYLQALRQYDKDVDIYSQNIKFGDKAKNLAISNVEANVASAFKGQMFEREDQIAGLKKILAEGALNKQLNETELQSAVNKNIVGKLNIKQSMQDLLAETSFKKQTNLIQSLQKRGDAQLQQAGRSAEKSMQSTLAEYYRDTAEITEMLTGKRKAAALRLSELETGTSTIVKQLGLQKLRVQNSMLEAVNDAEFNMRVLDADIESALAQSERDISAIELDNLGQRLNAFASLSISPQKLSYTPKPELAPERVFKRPVEADPDNQVVPSAYQPPAWGPLVTGVIQAAPGIAGIYSALNQPKPSFNLGGDGSLAGRFTGTTSSFLAPSGYTSMFSN